MPRHLQKIQRRVEELAQWRYLDILPVGPIQAEKISGGSESPVKQTLQTGDRWGERDAIYQMYFTVTIPSEWKHHTVALNLNFSPTPTDWTINTVEGVLSVNNHLFHAVDRYHREILLPTHLVEQGTLDINAKIWVGIHEDSYILGTLELRQIDEQADQLYLLMRHTQETLRSLPTTSPTYVALLEALDESCQVLDFTDRKAPAFYASCTQARNLLQQRLNQLAQETATANGNWQPHYTAIGHAHIDVAWLWRLRHTRLKAVDTFTTALYHMDRYPSFTFIQSQPQLYQFVKEDAPELYQRIKEKVTTGQWEPEGAMWVEADTNITGAESLVRQFLVGQRFFREEFGRTSRVLWLPDVFGYSAALPQLIKGAGADYFVTTKISWSDTNRIPMDTFWWEGLDGTRVLSYFITAQFKWDEFATYNADVRPDVLKIGWENYRQKDVNRELLLAYGYGDGGGGPTREMIEATSVLSLPISREIPTVSSGHVADFMERLEQRIGNDLRVPRWLGELYLEYHRGTYTSQARIKRANRLVERDLHTLEWLSSLALQVLDERYPYEELQPIWRAVLTNHFHDILPGSSIGSVYADALATYQQINETLQPLIQHAQTVISEHINAPAGSLVVFNTLPWIRRGLVEVDRANAQTSDLPYQEIAHGRALVEVRDVPSLGYRAYTSEETEELHTLATLVVQPNLLENNSYRIEFNEQGQITRLFDKQAHSGVGREILRSGERANVLQLFEDKPLNFDAWDIDSFYEQKSWELDQLVQVEAVEQGPLRAGLRFMWNYKDRTFVTQTIYLYAHSRRIDFVTNVDWQERQTLLKVAFPVDIHNGRATGEIQFGNIERTTHRNTTWDQARFETCAHKWFDLSEGDYGVAILNDCKYGYDVHEHVMRQTLLKGAISPDPNADLGQHHFTYSLFPHEGGWFEGGVPQAAYELNHPLLSLTKTSTDRDMTLPQALSLVQVTPANVIVETVKRAEESDALVIRLYECANRRGPLQVHIPFEVERVEETNLLEEEAQPVELTDDRYGFRSTIRPYQIKTFVVYSR